MLRYFPYCRYPDKISESGTMDVLEMVFAVVIADALALPSGNVAPSARRVFVYCRVPSTMARGIGSRSTSRVGLRARR